MSRTPTMLAVALLLVGVACPSERPTTQPEPPEWINRVFPPPGGQSAFTTVQVRFAPGFRPAQIPRPGVEGVRLYIDGVDVTTFAVRGPGVLEYDPRTVQGHPTQEDAPPVAPEFDPDRQGPVALTPGPHTARVERVVLPEVGADEQVLDFFSWQFHVQ